VSAAARATGDATVTYLGHATVAVDARGTRLLTDPLFRGSLLGLLRRRRPLAGLSAADAPDAVLLSHLHRDHFDLRTLRRLGAETPIVAPRGAGALLRGHGLSEVTELGPGERVRFGEVEVRAVPARHGGEGRSRRNRVGSLGYVIEADARVYFAGDTGLFDEMREIGDGLDLALLPIWGWGPVLGPGHLDPRDAARALELLRPRIAVPIHWGTYTVVGSPRLWPWMHSDPAHRFLAHAAELAPDVDVRVLEPGESIRVGDRP
jgi:L-ascorbate metabolism protein UlaG (beta-lactamase superfamily)